MNAAPPFPVNLNLRNRNCLVVGGGSVGTRKVMKLIECGAAVTLVSPEVSEDLAALAREGRIVWKRRAYRHGDAGGMLLVFSTTDFKEVNRAVAADARAAGALCNLADTQELCDFTVPAHVRRGDLLLTISTGGNSPALSRKLRQELADQFGPEYAQSLRILGAVRHRLLATGHDPERHRTLLRRLIGSGLVARVREGDAAGIDDLLRSIFGPAYRLDTLFPKEEAVP